MTIWGLRKDTSEYLFLFSLLSSVVLSLGGRKLTPVCPLFALGRFLILDVLGQGTFGQVVKCQNMKTNELVAVKVVKNKPAYFNQSMMEVAILDEVRFKFLLFLLAGVRPVCRVNEKGSY